MNVNEKYFSNISSRERAIFEGAITMGALFHQFIGTPVNKESAESLEKAMKESLELQPAIEKVDAKIDLNRLNSALSDFEYTSLNGDMLDIKIYTKVDNVTAVIRIEFIEELNYPLMYVENIKEE
ncbi:dihydroneopterin aldolase family protein [uncultured Methanobrevibacter sp.]|uniref:dihydroneopterin aldolase family protein n=1 Tax=uncultured Methanobrevibacter sp. TaxID=253161 RepID=UPI0025E12D6B|nr:dihydroneopterin aldolase family protein [uncultured Methanobrevibacter sp.]